MLYGQECAFINSLADLNVISNVITQRRSRPRIRRSRKSCFLWKCEACDRQQQQPIGTVHIELKIADKAWSLNL